jgi:RIO kinase 1
MLAKDEYDVSNKIQNQIDKSTKKNDQNLYRRKDKADRATIEHCLDPKTIHRLDKLKNKGDLNCYEGCISTGKEANVYYGNGFENRDLAIKIYKTSVLVFKDRDRYINGEFRFRHGYCKSNPRKMISLWAEKEVRNLKRIQLAGIKAPTPILLKSNLIIMELIGNGDVPAPRLKDAYVTDYNDIYYRVIEIMSTMFRKCKIVHSDFSEYNLLYHENQIYVIDVAQAVEDDHPNAMSFLKRDCTNINNYFEKKGVNVISNRQLFNIVSTFNKNEVFLGDIIKMVEIARKINKKLSDSNKNIVKLDNSSFENFEIPRNLSDLDEVFVVGNSDLKDALSKLCGINPHEESFIKRNLKENNENQSQDNENKLSDENFKEDDYLSVINVDYNKMIKYFDLDYKKISINNDSYTKEIIDKMIDSKLSEHKNKNNGSNEYEESESDDEENEDENSELSDISEESESNLDDNLKHKNDTLKLYFDDNGKIITEIEHQKLVKEKIEKGILDENGNKIKKPHNWNPFEGLTKAERKKKVKEENKLKRSNKKLTKYEKQKKIKKTSGKNK